MVPGQSKEVAAAGVAGLHRQAAAEALHVHPAGVAAAAAAAVVMMLQAPPHYPLWPTQKVKMVVMAKGKLATFVWMLTVELYHLDAGAAVLLEVRMCCAWLKLPCMLRCRLRVD